MRKKQDKEYIDSVPKYEIVAFARLFLPKMQAYFESEEGKREYSEWLETRKRESA